MQPYSFFILICLTNTCIHFNIYRVSCIISQIKFNLLFTIYAQMHNVRLRFQFICMVCYLFSHTVFQLWPFYPLQYDDKLESLELMSLKNKPKNQRGPHRNLEDMKLVGSRFSLDVFTSSSTYSTRGNPALNILPDHVM